MTKVKNLNIYNFSTVIVQTFKMKIFEEILKFNRHYDKDGIKFYKNNQTQKQKNSQRNFKP